MSLISKDTDLAQSDDMVLADKAIHKDLYRAQANKYEPI